MCIRDRESFEYYGHDAVVRVRPSPSPAGDGPLLVVRVTGGEIWTESQPVGLAVRGPVIAWETRSTPA